MTVDDTIGDLTAVAEQLARQAKQKAYPALLASFSQLRPHATPEERERAVRALAKACGVSG